MNRRSRGPDSSNALEKCAQATGLGSLHHRAYVTCQECRTQWPEITFRSINAWDEHNKSLYRYKYGARRHAIKIVGKQTWAQFRDQIRESFSARCKREVARVRHSCEHFNGVLPAQVQAPAALPSYDLLTILLKNYPWCF